MNDIRAIKERYALNTQRYTIKKGVIIINADDGRFVFKKNKGNDIEKLYRYLDSRGFSHYVPLVKADDYFNVYEYIDDIDTPMEQKAMDIMYVLSLLHNKTTHYKEVDIDDYKKIYEDVNYQIEYYYNYFTNLIEKIETEVYMSPASYLLARNISKIFALLSFCKHEIDSWYRLIRGKRKQRVVTLHNNLDVDHLLANNDMYLISWEKSKIDMPIYDIYNIYKKHYFDLDFFELLRVYEHKYPLLPEERKLLFVLLSLPEKLEFTNDNYHNCKVINNYLDYIYKTDELVSNYYATNKVE